MRDCPFNRTLVPHKFLLWSILILLPENLFNYRVGSLQRSHMMHYCTIVSNILYTERRNKQLDNASWHAHACTCTRTTRAYIHIHHKHTKKCTTFPLCTSDFQKINCPNRYLFMLFLRRKTAKKAANGFQYIFTRAIHLASVLKTCFALIPTVT